MDTAAVVHLARQALWIAMLISAPILGVGLAVGLIVGIFQAATSINEQTLSFIPKLIAVGGAIVIFGNWQLGVLMDYLREIYQRIPGLFN